MRMVVRLLIALAVLIVAAGFVFWRDPLWVVERLTQFQLLRAGIHSRSMVIDGYDVHYVEGGVGQPVVLIHGLGSQGQQDWQQLAPILVRAGYHVYAPDLLGYGRSAKPADHSYSIPEEAKLVESFLAANHLTGVALGGVSMGGWVAATVALDDPQAVSKLMLIDSAGIWFKLSFDRALFTPQTTAQVDQLMAVVALDPPPVPKFIKEAFVRRSKRDGWVVQRALASMLAGVDYLDAKFPALKMSILLVWGKQDAITPISLAESMHHRAPQSVLALYDRCGHVAVVTCMNRIAPTVLDFLSGTNQQPGRTIEVPAPTN
jgi:pimeloyl-ACP methyl ester carboxylesterase